MYILLKLTFSYISLKKGGNPNRAIIFKIVVFLSAGIFDFFHNSGK